MNDPNKDRLYREGVEAGRDGGNPLSFKNLDETYGKGLKEGQRLAREDAAKRVEPIVASAWRSELRKDWRVVRSGRDQRVIIVRMVNWQEKPPPI